MACVGMQVELLLTFEEYCAQEGEFAKDHGGDFADIFPQVPLAGFAFSCTTSSLQSTYDLVFLLLPWCQVGFEVVLRP